MAKTFRRFVWIIFSSVIFGLILSVPVLLIEIFNEVVTMGQYSPALWRDVLYSGVALGLIYHAFVRLWSIAGEIDKLRQAKLSNRKRR